MTSPQLTTEDLSLDGATEDPTGQFINLPRSKQDQYELPPPPQLQPDLLGASLLVNEAGPASTPKSAGKKPPAHPSSKTSPPKKSPGATSGEKAPAPKKGLTPAAPKTNGNKGGAAAATSGAKLKPAIVPPPSISEAASVNPEPPLVMAPYDPLSVRMGETNPAPPRKGYVGGESVGHRGASRRPYVEPSDDVTIRTQPHFQIDEESLTAMMKTISASRPDHWFRASFYNVGFPLSATHHPDFLDKLCTQLREACASRDMVQSCMWHLATRVRGPLGFQRIKYSVILMLGWQIYLKLAAFPTSAPTSARHHAPPQKTKKK